jgi:hypothetical protein
MGDRPGNTSQCWPVREVCDLLKLPDVSGPRPGRAGTLQWISRPRRRHVAKSGDLDVDQCRQRRASMRLLRE